MAAAEHEGSRGSREKSAARFARLDREEARSGQVVEARRRQLAELEAKAEEQGGFDKLEQSKFFGLSKNDIIDKRTVSKSRRASKEKRKNELYKQIRSLSQKV